MNIVTKSWTTPCGAAEFVAATAKAGARFFALALLVASAGCANTFADLPTQLGGMPAGTPERTAAPAPAAYPAVHDMPPPRPNTVLSPEEQKKAEAELAALRARQEQQAGVQKAQASQ